MTIGGTEIPCPRCGEIFLFRYGMEIKMSEFKCGKCGMHLWEHVMEEVDKPREDEE